MKLPIKVTVNGKTIEDEVSPRLLLMEFLYLFFQH